MINEINKNGHVKKGNNFKFFESEKSLDIPDGKKITDMPMSHFKNLVNKDGETETLKKLNMVANIHSKTNKELSDWTKGVIKNLKSRKVEDNLTEDTAIQKKDLIQFIRLKCIGTDKIADIIRKNKYHAKIKQLNPTEPDDGLHIIYDGVDFFIPDDMTAGEFLDFVEKELD